MNGRGLGVFSFTDEGAMRMPDPVGAELDLIERSRAAP